MQPIVFNTYKFSWKCFFLGHIAPRADNYKRYLTFESITHPGKTNEIAFYECGHCNKLLWVRGLRKT